MLKSQIEQDLKTAMLTRDSRRVDILRDLKSALLYFEVEKGSRGQELSDDEVIKVLTKELKKRREAADMFRKGGNNEKAKAEDEEAALISTYLPKQLSEEEIDALITESLSSLSIQSPQPQDMGKIIGYVKQKAGATVDGSTLARLVKNRLAP